MRNLYRLALGIIFLAAFYAPSVHAGEDQFFGTLTGAALGGIVGSQFGHGDGRVAAGTVGVLGGGWIGNDIGYEMDNRRAASTSSGGYHASVIGTPSQYQAGYTPNYVAPDDTPSPESVYDNSYSGICREYSEQVHVGNRVEENYGTACLQPDGTWRAVE